MKLDQLLAMLMALQSQGATEVKFIRRDEQGCVEHSVDWVAPSPLRGVGYVSLMPVASAASNEAMAHLEM